MSAETPPRFVFFDAVGTLLRPASDVATVYHQHGLVHGSRLSQAEIHLRFRQLYPVHFSRDQGGRNQLKTSEPLERQRWQALVCELFAELGNPEPLFLALWEYFARPENWELYAEVPTVLAWLSECRIPWGIASNFDRRLETIVAAKPELAGARLTITSAAAGWSKPALPFYQYAAAAAERLSGISAAELWMVGDSRALDVEPARASGWQAVQLEREQSPLAAEYQIQSLSDLCSIWNSLPPIKTFRRNLSKDSQ